MSNKENVLRQLGTLGIPYVCYDHPAAYTMQDCYELPFVTPELLFCKNLLLCNRQQTSFYLLVISPERTFRTAEVSHELGVSRLSFAPEDALPRLLGLEKGAVSPLGLWFDREKQVKLILERGLRRTEKSPSTPAIIAPRWCLTRRYSGNAWCQAWPMSIHSYYKNTHRCNRYISITLGNCRMQY